MKSETQRKIDEAHMTAAARLAIRGRGGAEPNPPVGCLIVSPENRVVGWGYHRRFGGPHAEVHALRRAGARARGATAYVTLEPCSHTGKTPPCTEALIEAGIGRVVIARRDPNPIAAGGVDRLRAAGLQVDLLPDCEPAVAVTDPFAHRVRSGLPWVIAKWAQTLDGRVATREGKSRWISGEVSRRMVHRERGRVDAILTGIGTVLADDPLLTAREVRVRRLARRVVIDPLLRTPPDAQIVTTAKDMATIIACDEKALEDEHPKRARMRAAGVELIGLPVEGGELSVTPLMRRLVEEYNTTNVLVEAGPRLLAHLLRQNLVKEAWVFVAPLLLGDDAAVACLTGREAPRLTDGLTLSLVSQRRRGGDAVLRYRVG
ncbi:MAG: bifunctional diaminohydroxyphosphoribosylaminopyrimidine deaminase/5-amino-6-(5-phosphoribosylamino)uracil reductase RibD [Planctomycetota bacterium]|nr:bifunctional diaminohydroxyphosphoribosylaminopyrimidine deaminase/5-amino-6-(5-phosphoribosylamino)uracil reductase RibD [Planctomycetota bacterium]